MTTLFAFGHGSGGSPLAVLFLLGVGIFFLAAMVRS